MNISDAAKAVAHPLRARLLAMLAAEGERCPRELADAAGQPLTVVAYHVGILRDLGAVVLTRTEQRRGATAHFYRAAFVIELQVLSLPSSRPPEVPA